MSKPNKQTILVVDDTQENIDVLTGILGGLYTVKIATNGALALKIAFSAKPPDLILLDVMMPEMDGYEVCRQLKENELTRKIPVIFVTALSEAVDEARGFALGAVDFITKPVRAPVVLARAKSHLLLHDRSILLEELVEERTADLQAKSRELLAKSRELEKTRLEIIHGLARAAEYRDNETGYHVVRMSTYVKLLAIKSGVEEAEAEQIMFASMMHDTGKIGIPDHILLKPGRLTDEEFAIMKRHTLIGAEIIGKHDSMLLEYARTIALTHHEKWNGTGYPNGLKGEEIPLAGRLTTIADVFDALTSVRPYKDAWSVDDALDFIQKQTGELFDPRLVPLFVELRPEIENIMQKYRD